MRIPEELAERLTRAIRPSQISKFVVQAVIAKMAQQQEASDTVGQIEEKIRTERF